MSFRVVFTVDIKVVVSFDKKDKITDPKKTVNKNYELL